LQKRVANLALALTRLYGQTPESIAMTSVEKWAIAPVVTQCETSGQEITNQSA
jgi:hypothetical protein